MTQELGRRDRDVPRQRDVVDHADQADALAADQEGDVVAQVLVGLAAGDQVDAVAERVELGHVDLGRVLGRRALAGVGDQLGELLRERRVRVPELAQEFVGRALEVRGQGGVDGAGHGGLVPFTRDVRGSLRNL